MTYRGHIKNGVVVLDEPVPAPEGTEVEVRLVGGPPEQSDQSCDQVDGRLAWLETARALSQQMPRDLPADLAEQHDHYIHGTPKR